MKYPPQIYARALAEVASQPTSSSKTSIIVKNFLALILKNGDAAKLKKISGIAEEMVLAKTGRRKITIESARPLKKMPAALISAIGGSASGGKKILAASDVVESKIEPSLIAGLRITVNKNLEWDGSLAKKLGKLFG